MATNERLENLFETDDLDEKFDPLDEDFLPDDEGSDKDEDSTGSSVGATVNFPDMEMYGVTPPTNFREIRREKGKRKGRTKSDQKLDHHKTLPRITMLKPHLLTCTISQTDSESEDVFDTKHPIGKRKRDSSKIFKSSRTIDRDFKHNGSEHSSIEAMSFSLPNEPLKVDSPNRYLSLDSQPLHAESADIRKPTGGLPKRRQVSIEPLVCSRPAKITDSPQQSRRQIRSEPENYNWELIKFHRTFTLLLNLGNNPKKEKENKLSPLNRQKSTDQEVWQTRMSDLIWLELQAWKRNLNVGDQDKYLCSVRKKIPAVLDKIMNFKVRLKNVPNSKDIDGQDLANEEQDFCAPKSESFTKRFGGNCCRTNKVEASLMEEIQDQKEALVQVDDLLDELDNVEQLFPTYKAFGNQFPLYASDEFQNRVNTLCLWVNITKDIARKLYLLADVLQVRNIEGLEWPWGDYEITSQVLQDMRNPTNTVTPQIRVEAPSASPQVTDRSETDSSSEYEYVSHADVEDGPERRRSVRFQTSEPSTPVSPIEHTSSLVLSSPSDTSTPKKDLLATLSLSSDSRLESGSSLQDMPWSFIYRHFADKNLKKRGLRKLRKRLKELLDGTLQRARQAMEPLPSTLSCDTPKTTQAESERFAAGDMGTLSSSPSLDGIVSSMPPSPAHKASLHWSRDWSPKLQDMGLPPFKPTYLFLVRIPLDVIHECLRLRLEQKPEIEPSLMSVRQLIIECKDLLLAAVVVKQYYEQMVKAIFTDEDYSVFDTELGQFEEDLKSEMEVYFSYIQTWMCGLQSLPEMSKRLKNFLEDEWKFTKQVCPHVRGGEANAANHFCLMASNLLQSISDFLEMETDAFTSKLHNTTQGESDLDRSTDFSFYQMRRSSSKSGEFRQTILQTCRSLKNHFHEARERASKALGFPKMLRKDLEIAADFNIVVSTEELMTELKNSNHYRVIAPHCVDYLMFIPESIARDKALVLQLLNVTCGREEVPSTDMPYQNGYLLLMKCDEYTSAQQLFPAWTGPSVNVDPTAETGIALSGISVFGLLLIVFHSSQLAVQRKEFEKRMGSVVQLVTEQTSCHETIADSLKELKHTAMVLRQKVADTVHQIDQDLHIDDIPEMDDSDKVNIHKLYRETLHQCYNFGFEYHKEVARLVSGETRNELSHHLVSFAVHWIKFVTEKCERGRGRKPRWAHQGLDFLSVVTEPRVLSFLPREEFIKFKKCIDSCVTHIVGENKGSRVSSPDVSSQRQMFRNISCPEPLNKSRSPSSTSSTYCAISEPVTPYTGSGSVFDQSDRKSTSESVLSDVELRAGEDGGIVLDIHWRDGPNNELTVASRRMRKIQQLEQERTNLLYDKRMIGRVTDQKVEVFSRIKLKRVNFKWQRGIRIGEGHSAKVYTAVNMDTGDYMALKEIRFNTTDHQMVTDTLDEIKIFRGIDHPNLVKYYGVEVHQDEMLIFMEHCEEGTLEEAAKQVLSEAIIRRYTSEILAAINVLHEHAIVHRDIKEIANKNSKFRNRFLNYLFNDKKPLYIGANIFLTSEGPVKLGDFGCSVKLKNHTTMPGEVNTLAGTTAFMAPEVITKTKGVGSGRAADIWSLGCVVVEMATGKRPYHELESNYAIMFRVGMGHVPPIPECLSEEGKDFLSHCLQADPSQRWMASQLLEHPFVKVYVEEDVDPAVVAKRTSKTYQAKPT